MSSVIVRGGNSLQGNIRVSGAKNSALKIIAAALFSNEDVILENVPNIGNVSVDLEIIKALGAEVRWLDSNKLLINGSGINSHEVPFDLGSKYRTAALHAAALVFRFGKAKLPIPGGCKIGMRPMNRWVETWEALGIEVDQDDKYFHLNSDNMKGANINFKINTHMGTDNAILFSMFAPGETSIKNAAEEPEVDDLIDFICMMGANVERVSSREIKVTGRNNFSGGTFRVMNDRNEVVTYAVAALVTKGNLTIKGVDRKNLLAFVNVLTKMGAKFDIAEDEMRIWSKGEKLDPVDIKTDPYPGFMTDWQPLITLLLTQAEGVSTVYDTIYTDRFEYTKDLNRMGANIKLFKPSELDREVIISEDTYSIENVGEPKTVAQIQGPTNLRGVKLLVPDLRAGATLVLAALMAEGKSEIIGFENVTRGYEDFVDKLTSLGANITRIDD